jgi:hypothetical protein
MNLLRKDYAPVDYGLKRRSPQSPMMEKSIVDGAIQVGLHGTTNGRSCKLHEKCGSVISVDSLIRFKWCQVE